MTLAEAELPAPVAARANGALHISPAPDATDELASGAALSARKPALAVFPGKTARPVRRYPDETVAAVRRLVEGSALPISAIAEQSGVGASTIGNWARNGNWRRPKDAPELQGRRNPFDFTARRGLLMTRLYRAFGRQLAGLEARAMEANDETAEKDARMLSVLAKTLETLTDLDRDGDGTQTKKPEPPKRADLRLELARRIAAWAEQGAEPAAVSRQPDG